MLEFCQVKPFSTFFRDVLQLSDLGELTPNNTILISMVGVSPKFPENMFLLVDCIQE